MSAPDSVKAGADFEVDWTGPNNDFDYIAIFDEVGAHVTHAYAFGDDWPSPAAMKAPDHPGRYELRFANFSDVVLATRALHVSDVTATLNAPASVRAGSRFQVEWTGPDNEYDYVGVFDAKGYLQSREFAFGEDFPSPAKIVAPSRPGTYEIRFVTDERPLASRSIVVR